MESRLRWGYRGLVFALAALLVVLMAVGCAPISGSDTTAGGVTTTAGGATTLIGETTTTAAAVTTTTLAPVTTLAPTTTLPPAATTTTDPLSSADDIVVAGGHIKAMGYITEVWEDASGRHLKIDYAVMLTGAAADAAAVAAGEIAPGETVPNDYFITNTNPKIRTFNVSDTVAITTSTRWAPHDGMGAPCSWTDFYEFWNLIGPPAEGDTQMPHVPWWIERDGNTIVKIDEQYLP
jgi:hypothetical protein